MLVNEAKKLFDDIPKEAIGFFPTPFYKLENLSKLLNVNLYIKRDDFCGAGIFGGNKVRKLQYLLARARKMNAEYVFTYGASQSNQAMLTATACRKLGLKPVLYLMNVFDYDSDLKANILLDRVLDAEIHIVAPDFEKMYADAARHMAKLEAEGHKCYEVPRDSSPDGAMAYIDGYCEMAQQAAAVGFRPDFVFHATGSGCTLAGLMGGHNLIGCGAKIISVAVSGENAKKYAASCAELSNKALEYIGAGDVRVKPDDFTIDTSYYMPGYEQPNEGTIKAIKMLAVNEGVFVDPVYTGKAFYGMLDYIEKGKVPKGSSVLFWHTGGLAAVFSGEHVTGNIY